MLKMWASKIDFPPQPASTSIPSEGAWCHCSDKHTVQSFIVYRERAAYFFFVGLEPSSISMKREIIYIFQLIWGTFKQGLLTYVSGKVLNQSRVVEPSCEGRERNTSSLLYCLGRNTMIFLHRCQYYINSLFSLFLGLIIQFLLGRNTMSCPYHYITQPLSCNAWSIDTIISVLLNKPPM